MQITKTEKGFQIEVPFQFKNAFKRKFPSAQWNSSEKKWEVGPLAGARLQQWADATIEAAAELEKEIKDQEVLEMKAEEIQSLREHLNKIVSQVKSERKETASAEELTAELVEIKNQIKDEKEKFEVAKAKKDEAIALLEKERNDINEFLEKAIDMPAIREAMAKMRRSHGRVGEVERNKFKEARSVMRKEQERLEEMGYGLKGLDFALEANFNRVDRDGLDNMPVNAMYQLYKIEDSEN